MTTETQATEVYYSGDSITDTFVFSFPIAAASEIVVFVDNAEDDTVVVTPNVDQSNNPGGSVLVLTPPPLTPGGFNVYIARATERTQLTQYPTRGAFPAVAHERALDKLTRITQELYTLVSKAVTVPLSYFGSVPVFPAPSAGKVLGWDITGTLVNLAQSGGGGGGDGTYLLVDAPVTFEVGPTGTYATLTEAFNAVANMRPASNDPTLRVTLLIQTGVVIAEQLVFAGRYGWVGVTSVDPEVVVNTTNFTVPVGVPGTDFSTAALTAPFMYVPFGCEGPVIATQFTSNAGAIATGLGSAGVALSHGGSIVLHDTLGNVLVNTGFVGFAYNIVSAGGDVHARSTAAAHSATKHNVFIETGGRVTGVAFDIHTADEYSIVVSGAGSVFTAYGGLGGTSTPGATDGGLIQASDGAHVFIGYDYNGDGAIATSALCTVPAIHASTGAVIDFAVPSSPPPSTDKIINNGSAEAVLSESGATVRITDREITATTAPANDLVVATGGQIFASGAIIPEGANIALNTITADGVVYA